MNVEMILEYIKSNNLTNKEFCKQCRISTSTFYRIMNNKNFNLVSLFKIAKKMNVRVCQLFA